MNFNAVLRLLHQGLSAPVAEAFSPDELAASPLSPDALNIFGEGQPDQLGAGIPTEKQNWRSHDPRFLERTCNGLPAPVYLAGTATSSLDLAHALIAMDLLPEWGSVLVLSQTAGRGQLRRAWTSPPGNLYAALRLPRSAPLDTEAAAPAIGGLIAEALTRSGYTVFLKWPNDILQINEKNTTNHDGARDANIVLSLPNWRKAGGILLEERADALVAGIGLNLLSSPDTHLLRDGFAFPAGCLQPSFSKNVYHGAKTQNTATDAAIPLFPLWVRLVETLFFCYSSDVSGTGSSWWPSLAQKHLAFVGGKVRLDDATPEHVFEQAPGMMERGAEGVIEGLCPSGALRLRTKSGTKTFFGGSLTPLS